MRYIAYFIGGPEDLTKRVLHEPHPVLEIPELLPVPPSPVSDQELVKVHHKVHRYERMHSHRSLWENADVFVYAYQGAR